VPIDLLMKDIERSPLQGSLEVSDRNVGSAWATDRQKGLDVAQDTLWPDEQEPEPPVQPLTREQAQALIARYPTFSVWRFVAAQAAFGVLVALLWGALSGDRAALWSALYGAAVAVVPNVLMARGVFGRRAGRSVGGLLYWEVIKIGVAGVMLALAPSLIPSLSWAAMLVTMVLCMKVIGAALLWQGRMKKF
jgi:ATP synthase protein I